MWVFKKPGHIVRKTFRCSISLGTLLSLRVMERLLSKKVQKMMISLSLPSKVMHVLSSRPVHPKEKMQTSEWSSRIVRKPLRYEFLSVKHESQKAFQRISFLYWIPTVFFGQLRSRKRFYIWLCHTSIITYYGCFSSYKERYLCCIYQTHVNERSLSGWLTYTLAPIS